MGAIGFSQEPVAPMGRSYDASGPENAPRKRR